MAPQNMSPPDTVELTPTERAALALEVHWLCGEAHFGIRS